MNYKCVCIWSNLTLLQYKQRFVNHECVILRKLEFDRWYLWLNTISIKTTKRKIQRNIKRKAYNINQPRSFVLYVFVLKHMCT